jgi:hypothetical protein
VTDAKKLPGEPRSYYGCTNHNARNCYKRQEDEKKKSPGTHKQAHQSILVDETAFQFSHSVLSIYHSDFPNNPHYHGNDWGEHTQKHEDQQEQDVTEEEQQWANDELYQDTKPDETTHDSSSASDPGSNSTLTVANTKEDSDTECQQIKDAFNATLIEPEVTLKESSPLKDTLTEIDAIQSSSSEPSWGQYRPRTQQELEQEWQVWDETNKGEQQETTTAYRHYRCESCDKSTSTTNFDTTYTLLCLECAPGRVTPEREDLVKATKLLHKKGLEKAERDDEEEWGRIPIPQSGDSADDYWLDDDSSAESESEQYEAEPGPSVLSSRKPDDDSDDASSNLISQAQRTSTSPTKEEKTQMSMSNFDDLAFLIDPRRDGSIKSKDDTVLTLNELTTTLYSLPSTRQPSLKPITSDSPPQLRSIAVPSWSGHLMRYQRYNLKMGYKHRTKMRSKLMKHIKKVVPKQNHIPLPTPQPQWQSHTAVTTQELISLYQQSQLIPT